MKLKILMNEENIDEYLEQQIKSIESLKEHHTELQEIFNILKSKRDEIVFKMKLTSKEETDILIKRVEILEKKLQKKSVKKKSIKEKKY